MLRWSTKLGRCCWYLRMFGHYPRGIWSRTKVWHRKARCCVRIPLPKHAGSSLLRYPKSRSQTLNGDLIVKVVHRLGLWVWHFSATRRCATCLRISLSEINSARRRRRIDIKINKFFFPSRSSINLRINSSLLLACLSDTELIMD
jgi:hypothetical protein